MLFLCLVPVIVSFLFLAAHFLHMGNLPLTVVAVLPLLLLIRHRIVARSLQVLLMVAAFEWVRTVAVLIPIYNESGRSWTRMAVILLTVAAFTFLSSLVFFLPWARRRYC